MKLSIKIVLLIGFVLSVYYVWNQYEMYRLSKEFDEWHTVDSKELTKGHSR
ncbi:hypothetical protein [Solibacillus isronensis]|uniref:hypothetical protein n=1 Tax=Solibacillus isronensis TaxID=412383 RepID=UPI0020CA913C|nr:hypothetical protein [Solibacillus isronensis]